MKEIELVNVNRSYRSGNFKITTSTEIYEECCCFEKVTYSFKYDDGGWPKDGRVKFLLRDYFHHYYYFLVSSGKFVYDIVDRPLDAVEVYYYRYNHTNALVVGFTSDNKATTYLSFNELRDSQVSSIMVDSFSRSELLNLLISLNAIINSKIKFFPSEGTKIAIRYMLEFVGPFKVIIFTPDLSYGTSDHRMFSNDLFDKYKSFNNIYTNTLSKLTSKEFNSINVFYTYDRKLALMVDFIDDCRKYQFVRVEENSWDFQTLDANETDGQLIVKLGTIYKNLKFKSKTPISHGHVLLDVMDIDGVEVTRVRRFSYKGAYLGLLLGLTLFLSLILIYVLLTMNLLRLLRGQL